MKTRLKLSWLAVMVMALTALLPSARAFYAPTLQRWMNRDPLGEPGFEVLRGKRQPPERVQFRALLNKGKTLSPEQASNLYLFAGNDPLGRIDPHGLDWSSKGKAIWTALGYIVPGGEFPAAAEGAPDCAKIVILNAFKSACAKCMYDPPASDPDCKICDDYEKIKAKFN